NLQSALAPWASGAMADPANNPVLARELATMSGDVTNQVNQQFAAAGRDLSPDNSQALARGLAQGAAPLIASAQSQGLGAAGALLSAGNTRAPGLPGRAQTGLGDRQAGINAANAALAAQNWGPNAAIGVAQQAFGLPLQNLAQISAIADPLAREFATTTSD